MRPGGYFFEDAALYAGDKAQNGTMRQKPPLRLDIKGRMERNGR